MVITRGITTKYRALLVLALITLCGCQNLSRLSIDDLLGPPPPRFLDGRTSATPELVPQPPPRADSFVLEEGSEVVGQINVVLAQEKDTLIDIARRYGLGYKEIRAANPNVDPWLPKAGTPVVLPTRFILPDAPREGIVLNLAAMRLFYYPKPTAAEPSIVITHPIAIGREDWPTPRGSTQVVSKVKDPSWNVPASIRAEHAALGDPLPAVVPPGPDNPLGRYALRLALPGYLIHGTNKPAGIGMRVTHGCIQLFPEDIAALFPKVQIGTPVRIVQQPDLAGWDQDTLYLEAHPPLDAVHDPSTRAEQFKEVLEQAMNRGRPARVDWERIKELIGSARGFPVPIERDSPGIEEVIAAAPVHLGAAVENVSASPAGEADASWYVQAGSFKDPEAARKLSAMLEHLGHPVSARLAPSGDYHRVMAGPYRDRREAEEMARRIEAGLGAEALIVQQGS